MLSINNLSITQKFNNNRIEGQKFHQSPMISNASPILQHDTVSFGFSFKKLGIDMLHVKRLNTEFVKQLESGTEESFSGFIKSLNAESLRSKKAFVLFPDKEGNSNFVQIIKRRPEFADKFLEFVSGLNDRAKKEFALMTNDEGHTHFNIALQNNRSDIAMDFLTFVSSFQKPIQRMFALSTTNDSFKNQYAVALELGYYDVADSFLDFVKQSGDIIPSRFFLMQDIRGKLTFEAARETGDPNVLKSFADFTSEAVSREYLLKQLQEALAMDTLHSEDALEREAVRHLVDSNTSNPFFPSGFWKMPDASPATQVHV